MYRNSTRLVVPICFFLTFLLVGLNIYGDYGTYWDEAIEIERGAVASAYVAGDTSQLMERYYGPAFELVVQGSGHITGVDSIESIISQRHLLTFLLFVLATIFFYLVIQKRTKSVWWGLLGATFLIFSPRIFAHSFFNSKDMAFLSLFVISVWSLINFVEKKDWKWALLHGALTGLLIDIRVLGVLVPFITIWAIGVDYARIKKDIVEFAFPGSLFLISLASTTILFWPLLWSNPFSHLWEALMHMALFPWQHEVFYLGSFVRATTIPWHYILAWIGVSTPVLYVLLALFGIGVSMHNKFARRFSLNNVDIVFFLWLFLPLFGVLIMGSTLYNGWRHLFFIYPAILFFAVMGLRYLVVWLRNSQQVYNWWLICGIWLAVLFQIVHVGYSLVVLHPHQYVYFNSIGHGVLSPIRDYFEQDYWGLSYRDALHALLQHDTSPSISLYAPEYTLVFSTALFPDSEKERLQFVSLEEAQYTIVRIRSHQESLCHTPIIEISAHTQPIALVCRLN